MSKRLVEDCLSLDLAWLMRLGPISNGQAGCGEVAWSIDAEILASAYFRLDLRAIETAQLILCYTLAIPNAEQRPVQQVFALTALPQHFGGHRWWLLCPATGDRVRKLHLPLGGDRFASRKAWGLAYNVERLNRFDRPFEKLFRAQRRLGNAQAVGTVVERPKGMWQRTFTRHIVALEQHDYACIQQLAFLIN